VHDIGKNIVGVVLQCNNYEVVDLGVMVPADRILDEAEKQKVDIIGLSGLITPSLDEMAFVASEMQRRGFKIPLLIGGATTSKTHTAVKIAPKYEGATTYVLDASRAVGVVSQLLSPTERDRFMAETLVDYEKVRVQFARGQSNRARATLAQARDNAFTPDWSTYDPPKPSFLGTKTFAPYDLPELARHIDWTPFFASWELVGHFPQILEDDVVGEAARDLYKDAQAMLARIIQEGLLEARGVVGFWPANSDGDDVVLYADESRRTEIGRLHTLRQQMLKSGDQRNVALADFVAPIGTKPDWVGGFAVTAGHGELELAQKFREAGDDYSAILSTALADRLAEAFAEALHRRVRTELWGYASDEAFDIDLMVAEQYRGIRPAPGYPACPDHSQKPELFRLLNAGQNAGITLTESFAMMPTSAVSGYYFAHPDAQYFGVARIGRDQLEDYARRRGVPIEQAEKWLRPNIGY
jgi:5-methyltetrahydrofolate--homocysteine methyltransferase